MTNFLQQNQKLPAIPYVQRSFYYKTNSHDYDNQLYVSRVLPAQSYNNPRMQKKSKRNNRYKRQVVSQVERPIIKQTSSFASKKLFLSDLVKNFKDLQRYIIQFDFLPYYKAIFPKTFENIIDKHFVATIQPYLLRYDHFKDAIKIVKQIPKINKQNFLSLVSSADSLGDLRIIFEEVLASQQFREQLFDKMMQKINQRCQIFNLTVSNLYSIHSRIKSVLDLDFQQDYFIVGNSISDFRVLFQRWKKAAKTKQFFQQICDKYSDQGPLRPSRTISLRDSRVSVTSRLKSKSPKGRNIRHLNSTIHSNNNKLLITKPWYQIVHDKISKRFDVSLNDVKFLHQQFKQKFLKQTTSKYGITMAQITDQELLSESISYQAARQGRLAIKSDEVVQRLTNCLGWVKQIKDKIDFEEFAAMSLIVDKKQKQSYILSTIIKYFDPQGRGDLARSNFSYWLTQSMRDVRGDSKKMMADIIFLWLKQNGMTYSTPDAQIIVVNKFNQKANGNQLFFRYIYQML